MSQRKDTTNTEMSVVLMECSKMVSQSSIGLAARQLYRGAGPFPCSSYHKEGDATDTDISCAHGMLQNVDPKFH